MLLVAQMGKSRLGEVKSLVPKALTVWFQSPVCAHRSWQTLQAPASLGRRGSRPGHLPYFRGAPSAPVSGFPTFVLPTSGECPLEVRSADQPQAPGGGALPRGQEARDLVPALPQPCGCDFSHLCSRPRPPPTVRGLASLTLSQALTNFSVKGPDADVFGVRSPLQTPCVPIKLYLQKQGRLDSAHARRSAALCSDHLRIPGAGEAETSQSGGGGVSVDPK